jgi:hypothetical protein
MPLLLRIFVMIPILTSSHPAFCGGSKPEAVKTISQTAQYVPNQILVSLKKPMSTETRKVFWAQWNLEEREKIGESQLYLLEHKGTSKIDVPKLVKEIEKNSDVKYAEPNMIQRTFSIGS